MLGASAEQAIDSDKNFFHMGFDSLMAVDFKSRLQELLQRSRRELPVYELIETTGPAHERAYRIDILIDGRTYGTGQGRTKKSAEQNAAQATLILLDESQ